MPKRTVPLLLLVCLSLLACGEDPAPPLSPAPEGARPGAAPGETGDLLEDLRRRLEGEAEVLDDRWVDAVGEVGVLLWPGEDDGARVGRRNHHNLALIAGDVSVQLLVEGDGGRERFAERDPTSLAIHDAFRAALAEGSDGYRAWVDGEGRALLERRMEALQGG